MIISNWQTGQLPHDWDTHQDALQAHFLQRHAWAAFQQARGQDIYFASGDGWSWLAIIEHARFGARLYAPYGPTAASPTALQEALASMRQCAQELKLDFARIEPIGTFDEKAVAQDGGVVAPKNIQPQYTLVQDLTKSKEDLMSDMTATNRNLYRTAGKKGLEFRSSNNPDDISILLEMIHEVSERNGITAHEDDYYHTMASVLMPLGAAKLYIIEHNELPVAASLVLDSPTTRYYAHAGSHFEARKLHPGTPLLAHMIFDAKEEGRQYFDFFGIAPPHDPDHPWVGFTKFKQSFGGNVVERVGTWDVPVNNFRYKTYRQLRRFRSLV